MNNSVKIINNILNDNDFECIIPSEISKNYRITYSGINLSKLYKIQRKKI